jgi:hypothetical protein
MRVDPRSDLFLDSENWTRLLRYAANAYGEGPESVVGIIDGIRCMGACITVKDGVARIRPGDMDATEYADIKAKWMQPYAAEITRILGEVGRWADDLWPH